MLFVTKWFGVTGSNAERNRTREQSDIEQIIEKSLLMQANTAAKQKRPVGRGTHVKGVSAKAQFEVFDVALGRDRRLALRLAQGMFARPGVYPAIVRFGNADPNKNSDFKADVRSLSVAVELPPEGVAVAAGSVRRQDFSMQNATTLPINDSPAFIATMKVLRTVALAELQEHQAIRPYQQLRYWSTVPFRHGPAEVVKYSAKPLPDNPAAPLQRNNPNGLQDELIRHVRDDDKMSAFDFALQFLDTEKMTYWGKRQDANFWIENASVEWHEAQAPFHTVARLTLLAKSQLPPDAGEALYFDVTGNSTADSTPLGSINRARQPAEVASRKARLRAT
jgi:hypothetical protein